MSTLKSGIVSSSLKVELRGGIFLSEIGCDLATTDFDRKQRLTNVTP